MFLKVFSSELIPHLRFALHLKLENQQFYNVSLEEGNSKNGVNLVKRGKNNTGFLQTLGDLTCSGSTLTERSCTHEPEVKI